MKNARPPIHSLLLVGAIFVLSVLTFPSWERIDEFATKEIFSYVIFPEVPLSMVICIRLAFSTIIFVDNLNTLLFSEWVHHTAYLPGSSLNPTQLRFKGYFRQPAEERSWFLAFLTLQYFTLWCWAGLSLSFFLAGTVPLLSDPPRWMLRAALLSFNAVAPLALLVSATVKYVLWPLALKESSDNTLFMKNYLCLLEHNGNSFMALTEKLLLGGLPVLLENVAVTALFGVCYVIFSWVIMNHWSVLAHEARGPQTLYFFSDPTIGWKSTAALFGLLVALIIFYLIFWGATVIVDDSTTVETRAGLICVILLCVCRFGD